MRIFLRVFQWMPYARQAARRLRPSTRTRRRISAQFSMFVNTPVPHYSCLRWSANLGLHRGQMAVGQTKGAALFGRPSATPPGAALLPRRSDLLEATATAAPRRHDRSDADSRPLVGQPPARGQRQAGPGRRPRGDSDRTARTPTTTTHTWTRGSPTAATAAMRPGRSHETPRRAPLTHKPSSDN